MSQMVEQVILPALSFTVFASLFWALFGQHLPWFRQRSRRGAGPLLLTFGALAFLLGLFGWSSNGSADGYLDALYLAVQHLYLNAPHDHADHWAIQGSRLFAIASVVLIGAELIRRLFDSTLQGLVLLLAVRRVVIIGLGETGNALFHDIVDADSPLPAEFAGIRRKHIVVIELDERNAHIRTARLRGASVIVGNGVDPEILKRAGAHRAGWVFFTMPSDQQNIDAASELATLMHKSRDRSHPAWYIRLRDTGLERVLAGVLKSKRKENRVNLHVFNVLDLAAHDAVGQHLTDLRPSDPREVLHCIIVGFGAMGQLLARRVAESAHFENLKRTRMTIVYSHAEQDAVNKFRALYPALFAEHENPDPWKPLPKQDQWSFEESGVSFVCNGGFSQDAAAPGSREFVDNLLKVAKTPGVLPAVFLCGGARAENSAAFALRNELDSRSRTHDGPDAPAHPVHIFSYIPDRPPIAYETGRQGLTMFGAASMVCTLESVTGSLDRKLAAAFADRYRSGKAVANQETREYEEWEISSNLAAARHVHAKLAAIGLHVSSVKEGFTPVPRVIGTANNENRLLDDQLSKKLAMMEHNRWMAERLISGWKYGKRSDELRQRETITDWNKLTQTEKEEDFDQIDEAIQVCSDSSRFLLEERSSDITWGASRVAHEFIRDFPPGNLRIGWTGHRHLENTDVVNDALEDVLSTILRAHRRKNSEAAIASAHGSLAFGADQLVTSILLDRSVPYDLVLPSELDALDDIDKILQSARSVNRTEPMTERDMEYRWIAEEIAEACDLLIAVWDGNPARGPGGTAEVVDLVCSLGKPVIIISPTGGTRYIR